MPRVYMDSMIVHNFKSFKHANIKFIKGFNCVLGPNGSGKSNIWDALMFALGETSLKRLRVNKASELINVHASGKDGVSKAYVKLIFSGDKNFEVMRAIKSNGKVAYKIDGRRARRQDLIDALRTYRCYAGETNTIAQGEITYLEKLNPKGRRELIDAASGIKEFDEKRDASMKELERVEQSIREAGIELDLKRGFLLDIEQQKADAEKYLALKEFVSKATLSLLIYREEEARKQYSEGSLKASAIAQKISDLQGALLKSESEIARMLSEKALQSRELNDKSIETGSIGKKIEHIEREMAINQSRSQALVERIKERNSSIKSEEGEMAQIMDANKANLSSISELNADLESKQKALGGRSIGDILKEGAGDTSILEEIEKNQNEAIALQKVLSEKETQMAGFDAQIKASKYERERINSEISEAEKIFALNKNAAEDTNSKLKLTLSRKTELESNISSLELEIAQQAKSIEAIDTKRLKIREQIAMYGGSERRVDDALKASLKQGFYGRAYSLCTYSDEYANAIAAASSGRLGYFIVDNPGVADKAITILKEKKLGRASFIPLDGIISKPSKAEGLESLISHVKFESKLAPAFNYIFSDTYVIKSIDEAKRIGFGAHRYVTLDGELIERSGTISGGSMGQRVSVQILEPQIASLEQERSSKSKDLEASETAIKKTRSELAAISSREYELNFGLQNAKKLASEADLKLSSLIKLSKSIEGAIASAESKRMECESNISDLGKKIALIDAEKERMSKMRASKSKARISQEEIERYRSISAQVESIKVKAAELSKEVEMGSKRVEDVKKSISLMLQQNKLDAKENAAALNKVEELTAAKLELQEELKKHGDKYGNIISKIQSLDAAISKMAEEKGRRSSELSRLERDQMEANMKVSQLQVRISDLKSEISAYANIQPLSEFDVNTIEREVSKSKLEMEHLGAINLKAPEVYAEKKAEVDAAAQKMDVLNSEKESIVKMISEINGRKLNVFSQTFSDVNEKFKELYSYVFDGSAYLELDDHKNPLESGLHITIASGRNKNILVEQHSGGEKSLVILMLLFAIQTRNPMSFYLFDEVDISLDKENAKKLSGLIKELGKSSQMIVVSHKDTMVTQADSAIGVVRKDGESKVVGITTVQE